MTLDILIPQYKETDEIVKPLLDSIAIQQNVDFNNIGVIITNDGTDVELSEKLLNSYPFKITYLKNEHKGVSATRNYCLDHSKADYVMFCDADDMFYCVDALYTIIGMAEAAHYDTFISKFVEEIRHPETKQPLYVTHEMDSTFVHGKCHRRQYLLDKNIRWNDSLTIHEDSYFNCLCQKCTTPDKVIYCQNPLYLWKWRDESICRNDFKYILKTYNNMLDSNTALVNQFLNRGMGAEARFYAVAMIFDSYYTMNTEQWINQENKEYRDNTERRFKKYYQEFKRLLNEIQEQEKAQIIYSIRTRFFQEGLLLETITFDQWIAHIENDL